MTIVGFIIGLLCGLASGHVERVPFGDGSGLGAAVWQVDRCHYIGAQEVEPVIFSGVNNLGGCK